MIFAIIGWIALLALGAKMLYDALKGSLSEKRWTDMLLIFVGGMIVFWTLWFTPFGIAIDFRP